MSERERRGGFTEQEVEARLAEAGRVLVALPWAGCFPCGFRSLWPVSAPATERRRPPSSLQIDAMDQAYAWTALIRNQDERRVVLMRSLMLPPSPSGKPRYVWTWGRLRRATGLHPDTLKRRHAAGIGEIVQALKAAPAAAAGSIGSRSEPTAVRHLPHSRDSRRRRARGRGCRSLFPRASTRKAGSEARFCLNFRTVAVRRPKSPEKCYTFARIGSGHSPDRLIAAHQISRVTRILWSAWRDGGRCRVSRLA